MRTHTHTYSFRFDKETHQLQLLLDIISQITSTKTNIISLIQN